MATTRSANPGDLGGRVISGLEVRDAPNATYTDVDEGRREVKVEFPHETVDSYKTVFGTRAFSDSFSKKLPVMCWQHQLAEPIGRAISAQSLRDHNEVVGKFSDFSAVPLAHRAFSQIQDGTIGDFSFGFRGASYEPAPEKGRGVRRIVNATMAEFSPVTVGSIPGAKAVSVRQAGPTTDEVLQLRSHGLITQSVAERLLAEAQHRQWESGMYGGTDPEIQEAVRRLGLMKVRPYATHVIGRR
jgi:HK97 family phage prohead protease